LGKAYTYLRMRSLLLLAFLVFVSSVPVRAVPAATKDELRIQARSYLMHQLAAAIYISLNSEEAKQKRPNKWLDSDISNTDDTQSQAIRLITDGLVTAAAANAQLASVMGRSTRAISNTKYGTHASICKTALESTPEIVAPNCQVTLLQLLKAIKVEDRCQATTLKDLLGFLKAYYEVGFFKKHYKTIIDGVGFPAEIKALAEAQLALFKDIGSECGPEDSDGIPLGRCARLACPDTYEVSEVKQMSAPCLEAPDGGEDWIGCCVPSEKTTLSIAALDKKAKKLLDLF